MASIFQHLGEEHERLRQSITRLRSLGPDVDPRQQLYQLLCRYTAYVRAEENVFYSYLIHLKSVQRHALRGIVEHERLASLLRETESLCQTDARWSSAVDVLCEDLSRHLSEEEATLIPSAQRVLGAREAAGLGVCFAAEYTRIYRDLSRLDDDAQVGVGPCRSEAAPATDERREDEPAG